MNGTERQSNGVLIGVVEDLNDPEGLGRVRVRFPTLNNQCSDWAPMATLMGGPNRGTFFRPEQGDQVLMAFEHNNPRRPYILGALWSQSQQPPPDDGQRTQNNWRFIRSRSGHIVKLDDTPGGEKIELIDKDGQRRVVIDSASSKIQVVCQQGDVEVQAASGKVLIEALEVTVRANTKLTLQSNGQVEIRGATVNIN